MIGSVAWDDHGVTTLVQARHISATLPVILCAPHGGNAVDGDQSETLMERPSASPTPRSVSGDVESSRARGGAVSLVADVGTSELLEEIDRRLMGKFCCEEGGFARAVDAPAVVVARFHRKYADANRALEESSAVAVHPLCPRAKEVHECYHGAIETAVKALGSRDRGKAGASRKHGLREAVEGERQNRLLLLDIHGQCKFVDKVLIGTCNGKTADLDALNAPRKGFLWHLRRNLNNIEGFSAGEQSKGDGNHPPRAAKRAEEREGTGEGNPKKTEAGVGKEGVRQGDQDDGAIERGHEAEDDRSVVVLPLYGDKEVPRYTGGYTVRRHGALSRGGITSVAETEAVGVCTSGEGGHTVAIDAVQLEFGSRFRRTPKARAAMAEAVAAVIFDYLHDRRMS